MRQLLLLLLVAVVVVVVVLVQKEQVVSSFPLLELSNILISALQSSWWTPKQGWAVTDRIYVQVYCSALLRLCTGL